MKKLIALLLALLIFSSNIFVLASCGDGGDETGSSDGGNTGTGEGTPDDNEGGDSKPQGGNSGIKVPEYKDYKRDTVDFDKLVYERPAINDIITLFENLAETVKKNEISVSEQIEKIVESEAPYINMLSMSTLSNIYHSKDSTNEYWRGEYEYITTNYPSFVQAIEKLFVAAAQSPHKLTFENDYFGFSLDEYVNGGSYTDACVALMETEAALEAEYTALSTETVVISYEGKTDTYANIIAEYVQKYGENSQKHLAAKIQCDILLEEQIAKRSSELFIELLKVRAKISEELGYESYEEYAYKTIYHDYSPESLDNFIEEVVKYVIPVYIELSGTVFQPYINSYENTTNPTQKTDAVKLINSLYELYLETDDELGDVYSYMLQHKLYDIGEESPNRFESSFTTYVESNNSPFLFLTLENNSLDILTAAHEFGHFYDMYTSYNSSASLDFSEISSQALELLTLSRIESLFEDDKATYKYLYYLELDSIFTTIIFQTFYAACEIAIYELDYDEITKEAVDEIITKTAKEFSLSSAINDTRFIIIPHTMLYPFYVQSYSTSMAVAAQIFCRELENEGDGFTVYKALVDAKTEHEFEDAITSAGLDSPFDEGALKKMADNIYYVILGAHYFTSSNGNVA